MDGREGSFGGEVESNISRVAGTWHGKRPLSEGVGEGVFLVWTPGTWGEPMFTSGHFFSISATGCGRWMLEMANIGRHGRTVLDWGLLRETRDGPGGRVSLPDHRGSRCN